MDCKKALTETNGDFGSSHYPKKKALKSQLTVLTEKQGKGVDSTNQQDGKFGCAVNLSSETDFVAKMKISLTLQNLSQMLLNQ